jgi:hypothetical protein
MAAKKDDWWETRCQLMRMMGREDWHTSKREVAEEEILKAINDVKLPVALLNGDLVAVYPKSFDALLWFREHDYVLMWMQSRADFFREVYLNDNVPDAEEPFTLLMKLDEEVSYHTRLMAYAACQPARSVDRTEFEREDFDIPPPFDDSIDPIDLVRILRAFWEVNVTRLNLLPYLVGPRKEKDTQKRMSWNVFFATMAMNRKMDIHALMRDKSLISLLAQVRLAQPDIEDELKSA